MLLLLLLFFFFCSYSSFYSWLNRPRVRARARARTTVKWEGEVESCWLAGFLSLLLLEQALEQLSLAAAAAAAAHVTSRQANASISCSLFLSFYSHSDRSTSQRSLHKAEKKANCLPIHLGSFQRQQQHQPVFDDSITFWALSRTSSWVEQQKPSLYGLQLLQWCSFSFIYSLILTRKRGGEKILLKCFTFFVCLFTLQQRGLLPKPFLLFFSTLKMSWKPLLKSTTTTQQNDY